MEELQVQGPQDPTNRWLCTANFKYAYNNLRAKNYKTFHCFQNGKNINLKKLTRPRYVKFESYDFINLNPSKFKLP